MGTKALLRVLPVSYTNIVIMYTVSTESLVKQQMKLNLKISTALCAAALWAFLPSAANCAITLPEPPHSVSAPKLTAPKPVRDDTGTQDLGIHAGHVGDGDAILLTLPDGKVALIDGGPSSLRADVPPPVVKLLKAHKVKQIDYLVLTHPHADHIGGLPYVASHFKIGALYTIALMIPKDNQETRDRDELFNTLRKNGVPIIYPAEGDRLDWGPQLKVRVLNAAPQDGLTSTSSQMNNASLVLQIFYAGKTLLLTGDIEAKTEQRLLFVYKDSLKSDILKVPHHGSKGSNTTDFLKAVSPSEALICAGPDSMYGFPHPEVMKRLEEVGATVHSTSDGKPKDLFIKPETPQ